MKTLSRSDNNLQLSRRLDWRFLLPEPSLRRVAYWGSTQSALALALRHFSEELTIFETPASAKPDAVDRAFDLVVLPAPTLAQLESAHTLLMPQGHLYAEVQHAWEWRHERKLPAMKRRLPSIAAWQETLARLGFVDIKAHWHRPSFDRAVQIIPMFEACARDFVFARRSEDLMSQLKFATGRSLMKNAWLARLLQCVSLVACKQ